MLFDNFDKKIKEAAEQHHPAYDENAWRKMEHLLNEHLPQKRDKRRYLLLALSVLLIGGGAFFLLSKPHAKNYDGIVKQTNSLPDSKPQADKADKDMAVVQPGVNHSNTESTNNNNVAGLTTKIAGKTRQNTVINDQKISKTKVDKNELSLNNKVGDRDKDITVSQPEKKNDENLNAPMTSVTNAERDNDKNSVNSPVTKVSETANNTQQIQSSPAAKATPKKNGRPEITNGFSFFVSAGPDVSKAQNSKAGKLTMSWGLGVAYTLNRFTLKTGVFSANKKYWAGPEDYKLSYTPPPNLKFMGADANCRVIEIPVKLSYNFAVKNKSNWFAGAGLSSYLMKREDYLYQYKTSTGNSYYHAYEAKNENKHYFSVLNLSGGYSYQLSKTISLSAEPYVEVPLTGIGAGKVHLNSGGVLFTVGVSPFRK